MMRYVMMLALIGTTILFMGGLFAALFGFRLIGKQPADDPLREQRLNRTRCLFRVFGPGLMLFAIALLFAEPPMPPKEWRAVTTADGACRVEMPGEPIAGEGPAVKGLGKPEMEQRLSQDKGTVQYSLSYSDIPDAFQDVPPEKLLEAIGKNWLLVAKEMGEMQVVRQEDLSENGWPGKEIVIDIDSQRMQQKWFVVNKRLYRAIVSTPRDDKHLQDARRFLESLRIVTTPDADKGS